jgi:hypothetical protein
VQFLAPNDPLEQDAVEQAITTSVEGVSTRVMSAEHLVAIALRTGRPKDHARIVQFIEQDAVDRKKLRGILERHGLNSKWTKFESEYLGGARD